MARSKKTEVELRLERQRATWTRFNLLQGQDWPTWSTTAANPNDADRSYIGTLAGVTGCLKVWLGRKVEDPEQAVFVVVWESEDTLNAFQASSAGAEFLQALLKPSHLAEAPATEPPTPRLLSLRWASGFRFAEDLLGRVTITTLSTTATSSAPPGPDRRQACKRAAASAFVGFSPHGCDGLTGVRRPPYAFSWSAWAWVDEEAPTTYPDPDPVSQQLSPAPAGSAAGGRLEPVFCYLWRWNGNGATSELEEASYKEPQSMALLSETVARAMPPVTAWEHERWDFVAAPCSVASTTAGEENIEGTEGLALAGSLNE